MSYKKLNRVKSPKDLDLKILSEAHRLAPQRQSIRFPWAPAFATACVVGLGFVVAKPLFDNLKAPKQPEGVIVEEAVEIKRQQEASRLDSVESDADYSSVMSIAKPKAMIKELKTETPLAAVSGVALSTEVESSVMRKSENEVGSAMEEVGVLSDEIDLKKSRDWYEHLSPQPSEVMIKEIQELLEKIDLYLEKNEIEEAQQLLNLANEKCPECLLPDDVNEL